MKGIWKHMLSKSFWNSGNLGILSKYAVRRPHILCVRPLTIILLQYWNPSFKKNSFGKDGGEIKQKKMSNMSII